MSSTRLTQRTGLLPPGIVGLLLLGGCAAGTSSSSVQYKSEDWAFGDVKGSRLTTEHYVLCTTCKSRPLVASMPAFVESCWTAYSHLVPPRLPPDKPMETYLFQSRWEWERFTEQFAPQRADTYKRIRSGGYSERGITVSHYGSRRSTLSTLAHEGLHQYLEATRGDFVPAWLNEGLATRFEAFDLDANGRPIFTPDKNYLRLDYLRTALASKSLLSLRDILGTHAGIEIQKQSTHVATYYSQVWSLVLYLLQPPRTNPYHDGFQKLLAELGSDAMMRNARAYLATDTDGKMSEGEAVFRSYITEDLDKFQADYEAFLRKLLRLNA
jgi:hypothetical protein